MPLLIRADLGRRADRTWMMRRASPTFFAAENPDSMQAALDQADIHDRLGLTYVRLDDWSLANRPLPHRASPSHLRHAELTPIRSGQGNGAGPPGQRLHG